MKRAPSEKMHQPIEASISDIVHDTYKHDATTGASAKTDIIDCLTKLSKLHTTGALSDEEFAALKAKLFRDYDVKSQANNGSDEGGIEAAVSEVVQDADAATDGPEHFNKVWHSANPLSSRGTKRDEDAGSRSQDSSAVLADISKIVHEIYDGSPEAKKRWVEDSINSRHKRSHTSGANDHSRQSGAGKTTAGGIFRAILRGALMGLLRK